ncbi:TIGR02679 domain-containing protein, partial [[Ruminococcus] torques]|uniref:TIGR02679 domain-containing protein n=1 Tax=[Ruminococcus] torques TaxID=33039 RepID=UPI0023B05EC4
ANVTGNNHYFDEGKTGEILLFNYLGERNFDLKQEGLSRAEYKNRIYYEAGILKDEVSNDALAYGIHGWKPDGGLHEGIEGFLENSEPVKLTLQTIGRLE